MQTITVRLENVELKGPFKKSYGNKESEFYAIKLIGGGKTFTRFQSDNLVSESIGDLVNIAYETKIKKFTNKSGEEVRQEDHIAKKIEVLPNSQEDTDLKSSKSTKTSYSKVTTATASATSNDISNNIKTTLVSKDTSMEVSGILQSLISTGMYNTENNRGNKTFSVELLEIHLRNALDLKRRVASELESTGKVL